MRRLLATSLALVAAGGAAAATLYNPQVAYTQEAGKGYDLILANADGSHALKVASFKGYIHRVDFAPGGGRLAYASSEGIRVLDYVASNTGIVVTQSRLLVPNTGGAGNSENPDFSPDGTRLVFRLATSPSAIRVIDANTGAVQLTWACQYCDEPRWLRTAVGDAFAFLRYDLSVPSQPTRAAWTALVNADGSVIAGPVLDPATAPFMGIESLDVARTRNSLLMTVDYPTVVRSVEVDMLTGAITDRGPNVRTHFSADDTHIIGLTPHAARGDYVVATDVSTGLEARVTAKSGTYGVVDSRP